MATQGDLRKWFMKQPQKKEAGTTTPSPAATAPAAKASVKSAEDGGKNTSKYFSNKPPADILKPVAKTTPAKPSPQRGKRLSSSFLEESDEDEINVPSPKIPRASNKGHHASGSTPNGAIKDSKDNVVSGGKGRGRGRAGTSSSLDADFDEASSGVGRGRGKGKGAIAMASTTTDAEPKQPVSRGRGSGESPSKQADTKAAPSGRGRGGGGGGGFYIPARVPPPHKGEKELPEGAEDALAGLTFVISGTLDSLEREEAEHLIKCHGGRVTTSVSKKTDYLLADEDIGGRKSQKAKELGVKFLTEDGLFDMIRKSKKSSSSASKAPPPPPPPQKAPAEEPAIKKVKLATANGNGTGTQKADNRASISNAQGAVQPTETDSWPHKHRPQSTNDIIGNQSIVKQVQDWLLQWDANHGSVEKGKKSRGNTSSAIKKAVLLSGPPGIGKTTTARLLCQELGLEALEVNASDSRGKADSSIGKGMGGSTANTIKEMVSNASLSFGGKTNRKAVLIMDEVDGMSGGDRGGIADLIASIKASHIPIICICNDRYSQKLKSLINYCLPLPFRKPTKQQMAKRLQQIAKSEGLQFADLALEELADQVKGDMRMALNQMQYMSLRSPIVNYADMRTRLMMSAKDEDMSPFSAVDKLLGYEGGRLRMDDRMDAAMSDMDLVPLLIQENYLNYRPSAAGRDDNGVERMDLATRAATSIADGDVVNVQIRRFRQWQHAQMGAFMSSIIPYSLTQTVNHTHGTELLLQGERNFNRFGGWLGKNSTYGKKMRLLEDVHVHLLASHACEPTREAIRLDYVPLLSLRMTHPLHNLPKEEAVNKVVDTMDDYSLTQEDFDTIIDLSKFQGPSLLDGVPSAVKAALTKAYKQREGERRVRSADLLPVLSLPGLKKAPKKPARLRLMNFEDAENEEVEEQESEEAEEEEADDENKLGSTSALSAPPIPLLALGYKNRWRGRGGNSKTPTSQTKAKPKKSTKAQDPKENQAAKRKR
ncbi:unnamed protein product [Sphagnum balticum]